MKITSIRVRRLVSSSQGYHHRALEVEASVMDGDDPDDVREELERYIDEALRKEDEIARINRDLQTMRDDYVVWERQRNALRAEHDALSKKLRAHDKFIDAAQKSGIPFPDDLRSDELPF